MAKQKYVAHPLSITIGNNIKKTREELGLSQSQLALQSGFHRTYIGSVERAEKNISVINLEKISIALNTTIYDITKSTNV